MATSQDRSAYPPPIAPIDPTKNVIEALAAAVTRVDDLADERFARLQDQLQAESRRVDEQARLRSGYEEMLRNAEAKRIDAIRAVDVNAVAVANERATAQASVLASQVTASADTLRVLVATTAMAMEQKQTQSTNQIMERIAVLERTSYEGKNLGPPSVLIDRLSVLEQAKAKGEGSKAVSSSMVGVVMAIVGGIIVFLIQYMMTKGG